MTENKGHILVVEDEDALREVTAERLIENGYLVTQAATGEAACDLLAEFAFDIGLSKTESNHDFDDDKRIEWLTKLLQKNEAEKVLLICRSKAKAIAIEVSLRKRANLKIGIFHEDLTLIQRDRNAAWFAEEEGAKILICSEIGSEGRNFQFCHHLVLFDLPLNPELLEQRIGRLDRIGQKDNIQIHVPFIKSVSYTHLTLPTNREV